MDLTELEEVQEVEQDDGEKTRIVKKDGQKGWVPSRCLRDIPVEDKTGLALYNFSGDEDLGQLAQLTAGDLVTCVKSFHTGWALVRTGAGAAGYVPTGFVDWWAGGSGWQGTAVLSVHGGLH